MKTRIISLSIAAIGCLGLASCDSFLTQENTYQANDQTFLDSDKAVQSTTAPLYNYVWNDFNSKFYYSVGDGRANNLTARWSDYIYPYTNFTETSLSPGLEDAWGSFYSVIAQSNNVINRIKDYSGPSVSEEAKVQGTAEARFMRGLAYWYIGSIWNCAIIYTNTADKVNDYVCPPHRVTDVMEFAIRDLEYAAKNLSNTPANEGRVTSYSAFGILSRVYLSMAGLTTDGAFEAAHTVTASQFINEQFAVLANIPEEQMGLGHAFEMDPMMEDGFLYELAQAVMAKEIFPNASLKYMPPTKFMTGNIFRGHIQDALFNLVSIWSGQSLQLLGMMTEAILTPHMQDRYLSIENAQYIFNNARHIGDEVEFKKDGIIQKRAQLVLSKANDLLAEVEKDGLFSTIEQGKFGGVKRPKDGGHGLDGVCSKDDQYFNPFIPLMKEGAE